MMDHEKIKEGVRLMLEGIGEDINREGLLETPDRIARMCEQIYGGLYEDAGVHLRVLPLGIHGRFVISRFFQGIQLLTGKGDGGVIDLGAVIGGGVEGVAGQVQIAGHDPAIPA